MSHKRVVRVVSYEGTDTWVDMMLRQDTPPGRLKTLYAKNGTMRELKRIELGESEMLEGLDALRVTVLVQKA